MMMMMIKASGNVADLPGSYLAAGYCPVFYFN